MPPAEVVVNSMDPSEEEEVVMVDVAVIAVVAAVDVVHLQRGQCARYVRRSVTTQEGAGNVLTMISSLRRNWPTML
jgi:hypothetical protein